ncbi:hypothetical protein Tco_1432544, partial [Tanacetum coccineum]
WTSFEVSPQTDNGNGLRMRCGGKGDATDVGEEDPTELIWEWIRGAPLLLVLESSEEDVVVVTRVVPDFLLLEKL